MNVSKTESLWLSKKLWVAVSCVVLLLLLKLPTVHSAVDVTLSTPGTFNVSIPAGVTAVEVDLWGAGGSGSGITDSSTPYAGGSGSYVSCQLAITGPGPTTIIVIVGEGGRTPASYTSGTLGTNAIGGGGRGVASGARSPGGGGGRSAIKDPSNTAEDWVTAGGGGGGGGGKTNAFTTYHYGICTA